MLAAPVTQEQLNQHCLGLCTRPLTDEAERPSAEDCVFTVDYMYAAR